jgi:hypothetical protein
MPSFQRERDSLFCERDSLLSNLRVGNRKMVV